MGSSAPRDKKVISYPPPPPGAAPLPGARRSSAVPFCGAPTPLRCSPGSAAPRCPLGAAPLRADPRPRRSASAPRRQSAAGRRRSAPASAQRRSAPPLRAAAPPRPRPPTRPPPWGSVRGTAGRGAARGLERVCGGAEVQAQLDLVEVLRHEQHLGDDLVEVVRRRELVEVVAVVVVVVVVSRRKAGRRAGVRV